MLSNRKLYYIHVRIIVVWTKKAFEGKCLSRKLEENRCWHCLRCLRICFRLYANCFFSDLRGFRKWIVNKDSCSSSCFWLPTSSRTPHGVCVIFFFFIVIRKKTGASKKPTISQNCSWTRRFCKICWTVIIIEWFIFRCNAVSEWKNMTSRNDRTTVVRRENVCWYVRRLCQRVAAVKAKRSVEPHDVQLRYELYFRLVYIQRCVRFKLYSH